MRSRVAGEAPIRHPTEHHRNAPSSRRHRVIKDRPKRMIRLIDGFLGGQTLLSSTCGRNRQHDAVLLEMRSQYDPRSRSPEIVVNRISQQQRAKPATQVEMMVMGESGSRTIPEDE